MRINPVLYNQSIPCKVFRNNEAPMTSACKISFRGDVFVNSSAAELESTKKLIYEKFSSKLQTASAEDIENLVVKLKTKVKISEENLYKKLYRLTSFSAFQSLEKIQDELFKHQIPNISAIFHPYESIPENFPICLTNVFNYILKKNGKIYQGTYNKNSNIIADMPLLNYLESMDKSKRNFVIEQKLSNPTWIYFEDFENGYNFLNRENDLKSIFRYIENYDENYNEKIIDKAEKLGLNLTVIKNELPEEINSNTIAQNLKNIIPHQEEFSECIDSIINNNYAPPENIKSKKYILNFIDKMLFNISPEQYSGYLKNIEQKIRNFTKKNNIESQNVYYIIPSLEKSFITTIYQYKNVNNLENLKYIFPKIDAWYDKNYPLEEIPDKSAIVVLDDCIITGLTMAKESFRYSKVIKTIKNLNKDISVILASAVATKSGIDNLKNMIYIYKREKFDTAITGGIIPQWNFPSVKNDAKYLDLKMSNPYITAFTLPHMGPDTNLPILRPLLEKFLFSKKAQQSGRPNLDFTVNF